MDRVINRRLFLKSMAASGAVLAGCKSLPSKPTPSAASDVGWYWSPEFLIHTLEGHRESGLRGQAVLNAINSGDLRKRLREMPARLATPEELSLAHSRAYIDEVRGWSSSKALYLRPNRWSPYGSTHLFAAAAAAAGSTIDLLRAVHSGELRSGFATVRPPGHHATFDQPFGYCVFNNIAVGIRNLQATHPDVRVAVIDIDAHHGNGIQDLFYEDPRVLYISTHQNEWPYSGRLEQTGKGAGLGTTLNIPLPAFTGDGRYAQLFEQVLRPAVVRHKPDLLVVAAGFDAHWRDPNSFLALSLTGYAEFCAKIVALSLDVCRGRTAFVLEGGYDIQVLEAAVANTFAVLLGTHEVRDPYGRAPEAEPDLRDLLVRVKKIHQL